VEHDAFVESIHKAQFKQLPSGFHALTPAEIQQANSTPSSSVLPRQEKGTRASRALPYELYANGKLTGDKSFAITFEVRKDVFGNDSAGSPFHVYSYGSTFRNRAYAVIAGDALTDSWTTEDFNEDRFHFKVHGPNGFFREFKGSVNDPAVEVSCAHEKDSKKRPTGNIELTIVNRSTQPVTVSIVDNSYKQTPQAKTIGAGDKAIVRVGSTKSSGWYDSSVIINSNTVFENRFAGRVETGKESISDPGMA
jgi:phospholipase C